MPTYLYKNVSDRVIRIFYEVYNDLGYGFLEKVYQNAMYFELKKEGYKVEAQKRINVFYKNQLVGEYFADIVINDVIILELKACECLMDMHKAQLINYLKATETEIGLLLNFGENPEIKRLIYTNDRKKLHQPN
jgi:GxxExxY protein